jgi:hypothetical protein
MAQTGYTPIQLYYSSTTTNAPLAANLASGELAINITDGKLFYKDNANAVQVIGWKVTPTSAGGTGLTSYTAGDLTYYASGTTFTKLAIGASGRYLSSSGTAPQWSAPAALTETDDTNVTMTLGGSPSTALLSAVSMTLGWTGTLAATRGGTGFGSYAVGDILYADTTTSLAKLADVATGNALISGGVGVAPSWGKIGLTTHVSGTLAVGNGGTGITTLTANRIPYGNGASAFQSSGNLTFDGTTLTTSGNIVCTGGGYIQAANSTGGSGGLRLIGTSNNTNSKIATFFGWDGSETGSIQTYVNVTTYNTSSDQRLKDDIGVATDMSIIDNTIIHDFSWKYGGRVDRGVFAQEAHLVKPSAVMVGEDRLTESGSIAVPWAVDYSKYIPDLIVYCQQLKLMVNQQKAEIDALKQKIGV